MGMNMNFMPLMQGMGPKPRKIIKLKRPLQHTKNLFGPEERLYQGTLYLFEQNPQGDCLCLLNDEHLVDIDHRDIEQII